MTQLLLEAKNVTVSYSSGPWKCKSIVLKNIFLRIAPGEIVVLLGSNGTGKSTLLKALCSLIPLDTGTVMLDKETMGYVPEKSPVPHFLTAYNFLTHMGRLFSISSEQLRQRIAALLALTNLERYREKMIGSFSKGMLQRLLLAQALINDPDLLILDEPFSGLDAHSSEIVKGILHTQRTRNKAVLFTTHRNTQGICDRVLELKDGVLLN